MGFFYKQYRKEFFPKDNGKGSNTYYALFDVCCNGNKKTFLSAAPSKGYTFSKSFLAACCTGIGSNTGLIPPYNGGVGVPNNPPIPNCAVQQFAINNIVTPNNTAATAYSLGVYNQGNSLFLIDNLSIINSGTAPLTLTGFAITSTTTTIGPADINTTFVAGTVLPTNGVHNFDASITNIDNWTPGVHRFTIQAFGTSANGCTVAPISLHFQLIVSACATPVYFANTLISDDEYGTGGIGGGFINSGNSQINSGQDTLLVSNKGKVGIVGTAGGSLIIAFNYLNNDTYGHIIQAQRYSGEFTMNIANTSYPITVAAVTNSNTISPYVGGEIIIPAGTPATTYLGLLEIEFLVCGQPQILYIQIQIEIL